MASVSNPLNRFSWWRGFRNLFFFKSRPKWSVPIDWEKPENIEDYERELYYEGFITERYWNEDNLADYPIVKQDLADLEEHLMPIFWEYNQKARYYQNGFYKFQWIFMFGAFITTIFAVLTNFAIGLDADTQLLGFIDKNDAVRAFGIGTAVVSAITSYYTLLSNHGEPRKRWANYRRLAEELRMNYFRFLARLEPFDTPDRVDMLRKRVIEIRRKEHDNG
ncbi:MAG: DUF4231 domain-containing protein [Chloroflexi bacterium]|nr:MAG: hypothetical protein CUN54_03765 [Phototrophicales bacterium]RMF82211.1 MAG: DUF4231 domain-containing protein [Chloroflexota bacterium]